jgi:amidohydrolase
MMNTPILEDTLIEIAHEVDDFVLEARHYLHKNPYTRWEEQPVLDWVLGKIREIEGQYQWIHHEHYTGGLIIDMIVDPSLPMRLFRADIDALPITEETGLEFSSGRPGNMHACGHDIHSAMLLGAYKAIQEKPIKPTYNIRWVWQRAEENPNSVPIAESGGKRLVDEGVCEGIVSANALHIWSTLESGMFESYHGPVMANSDRICINIKTSGGHVASPNEGTNAARVACQICAALEGFPSLALDPLEPCVLEPSIIRTGTAGNIRPANAEVWIGNRHFLSGEEEQEYLEKIRHRIASVVAIYPDATADIEFIKGHPALLNDRENYEATQASLCAAGQKVQQMKPTFGGEDFAYYLFKVPGTMWFLGGHQEGTGSHHTPNFNPDESTLWRGTLYWLLLATQSG